MSHFVCLALLDVPVNSSRSKIENELDNVFAPFSENIEVAPYKEECWCVGFAAKRHARNIAPIEFGKTIDELRKEYWAIEEDNRPEWEDFVKELQDITDRLEKEHEMYNKPDPECEDCNGTGQRTTTYNPKSQWDWYEIGGRWTGMYSDYDPYKDPANQEVCWLCNGSGIREDWATVNEDGTKTFKDKWAEKCNGCNGCSGTGQRVKFSLEDFEGDILPASAVLNMYEEKGPPFAILTPEGDWIERGKMLMFGMAVDMKDKDEWHEGAKEAIDKFSNCTAVVVDCHI